jgi:N6-adenosine-specific RNA methylase IME4
MTLGDIKRFQLPPIDPAGAWLFLWRVASMQAEALDVAAAWGFTPKAEIVWVKTTRPRRIARPWSVRRALRSTATGGVGLPRR